MDNFVIMGSDKESIVQLKRHFKNFIQRILPLSRGCIVQGWFDHITKRDILEETWMLMLSLWTYQWI